jgi:hypothetical protein
MPNGWRIKVYGIINFNLIATVQNIFHLFLDNRILQVWLKLLQTVLAYVKSIPVTPIWKELLIVFNSGIYLFPPSFRSLLHSHFAAKRRNLFVQKTTVISQRSEEISPFRKATVISQRSEEILTFWKQKISHFASLRSKRRCY